MEGEVMERIIVLGKVTATILDDEDRIVPPSERCEKADFRISGAAVS